MTSTQTPTTRAATQTLSADMVAQFRARLRGRLIAAGEPGYDEARQVYNGMIQKHPQLIAVCRDVADVIQCVAFGREQGLTVAIRGGGHNAAGLGVCDGGLVIDLAALNGIRVDPEARTARVGGGCIWGDVDHATHAFGLAVTSGIHSTTGVGGLTLGGGVGNLARCCGLTIDNLLEADVVLADGRLVTASAEEHPDLFWALRGGGGNFGVVTSFLFRLHPIGMVYGGPMLWPLDQAKAVLQWYRDFIRTAPEVLSGWLAFLQVPPGPPFPAEWHGKNMCAIVWCYTGALDQAESVFAPIRRAHPPAIDLAGPLPYPALQSMFDTLMPAGMQWYWRADFVNDLPDAAIEQHIKYAAQLPTMRSGIHFYPINGAVHRVGKHDTAFSYRDTTWAEVIVGVDPDPANAERIKDWAVKYWEAVHPYAAGGAYVNFMMEEGQGRIQATYRDNYARLAAVKRQYDPTNFFHVNQNISPAS